MPVRYTSARFVGREAAFAQLAARPRRRRPRADEDAPARRVRPGSASAGSSTRRSPGSTPCGEPMTVLRATAWPAHADEPYGPIIRAIGPTLRRTARRRPARPAGSGDVRGRPAPARDRPTSGGDRGADSTTVARPRRSDARHGRSRASSACSGGSGSATRSSSCSRTSTSPTPRPGRWSRSSPGSRATSGWPSSARTSPTSSSRDDSVDHRPRGDPDRLAARTRSPSRRSTATSLPR